MKISVSCKEPKDILGQADEIYVSYDEREKIADLAHNYDADIILETRKDIDINELKKYKTLAKDRLIADLWTYDAKYYALLKENGIDCVYHFPILTFASFKELISRGVKYINIDRPLIFQMDKLKEFGISVKFDPTHTELFMPNESAWVRPEDIQYYEPCILDFESISEVPTRVSTLIKIYKEGKWPGRLSILFEGIEPNAYGSMLPEGFGMVRSTCGQRCMHSPTPICHYCDIQLKLGNHKDKLKDLVDKK